MLDVLIISVVLAGILILSEILWKTRGVRGELARKFVHILSGSTIAFLPFIISYNWVAILGVGFIVANIINRRTPIFHAIHSVKRKSVGDILFGLTVVLLALIRPDKWLFAGAVLQVAVADGLAAVVGTKAKKGKYEIFGYKKTMAGTLTFISFSAFISAFIVGVGGYSVSSLVIVLMAFTLAGTENISGKGSDNITLPLGFLLLTRLFF